jgi:hypothetical protein
MPPECQYCMRRHSLYEQCVIASPAFRKLIEAFSRIGVMAVTTNSANTGPATAEAATRDDAEFLSGIGIMP